MRWALLLTSTLLAGVAAADLGRAPPDVRLLLDVSGSMQQHDPNNLRSDAVSLLVRALPDDGLGGIWIFANAAVPVVEHGQTDLFWKRLASIHTRELDSRGQRSNLPAALEAATWDLAQASSHERHIVLLSDGRIDVSTNATANAEARERFLSETLPKLAAADIHVHAVVLSRSADASLLRQLAQATGGHYLHADSGKALAAHFQKVLNRTAAPAYLSVKGQSFQVEPGLEEVTIFRRGDERGLTLIDPNGERYNRASPNVEVRWHDARGFDLLTLRRPAPGRWRFEGELDGGVMAFSDVLLKATEVPATLFPGRLNHVDFMLFNGGAAIVDDTFLQGLEPSATLQGVRDDQPLYVEYLEGGVFRAHMLDVVRAGPYVLQLALNGRTFSRQLLVPFDLANPVRVRAVPDEDGVAVWAELNNAAVDYTNLTVAAQVREGSGPRRLLPAEAFPAGHWGVRVEAARGKAEVGFNFIGNYLNQKEFELKTTPVKFTLPLKEEAVFVFDAKGNPVRETLEDLKADAAPEPEAPPPVTVIDANAVVAAAEQPIAPAEPELELPMWLVAAVAVANLILLVLLYFLLARPKLPASLQTLLTPPQPAEPEPAPV